ncbi:MAG: aconitate hydratase [Planctomycetota bacterium]|nr:aconitate hydratase AcnA [Planctomycetota bacterium]GIK53138.1 MAG: aconitate hydratase [Planctomycetota bacterium]
MTDYAAKAKTTIDTPLGKRTIYKLDALRELGNIDNLPYTIKILLEASLRNYDGRVYTQEHLKALCAYDATKVGENEIAFMPGRVVLQDFTGVPCVVDLAAMRDAMKKLGGDPRKVNPLVPCDLVIDHSVQVDAFGSANAEKENSRLEFERNRERYEFLKWGQQSLNNFRAVPPATGIVHQVNLEYLARVVWEREGVLYPDSCVGTDSHTTMINGLGVLGWGVGGIEAEAVMLGQPTAMLIPEVVGFKFTGKLPGGATATDLVLRVTEMLRKHGVVDKFVEFYGPGLADMPLATRATVANMAPEYGATCGFFPVDEHTLEYLRLSGRDEKLIGTVEAYCKAQGLWRDDKRKITYSSELELDLSTIEAALAGPARPQDRVALGAMKAGWQKYYATARAAKPATTVKTQTGAQDGSVVIAAITSCTNTSNPYVLIGAGLLARNAVQKGLARKPWVKTSLAPGSRVVTEYLNKAGVMGDLEALGFHVVGYGCTTCIGNSGPLPEAVSKDIASNDLVVASVLSGNRNFEGRVHPEVRANYLASPLLVVAYALAGTVDIDLTQEPLGKGKDGKAVYLKDIWPTQAEIGKSVGANISREQFLRIYAEVFGGSPEWKAIKATRGDNYAWDSKSTYIQHPPYFVGMGKDSGTISPIKGARCLLKLGDSVTTDHISPAGDIEEKTPAGQYLKSLGVTKADFNSYGSRRGNHEVMMRGTFANKRIKNQLAPGTEGGWTTDYTDGKVKYVYDASENYRARNIPLVVLAGKDYGMGSSRDWAAKGTLLLGVKAVIAVSFERIHRSNLIGMGVLPLTFEEGQDPAKLGLDGTETFDIAIDDSVQPRQKIAVVARKADGKEIRFNTNCRINTPVEVDYYRNGGILHAVLRRMAK